MGLSGYEILKQENIWHTPVIKLRLHLKDAAVFFIPYYIKDAAVFFIPYYINERIGIR